MATKLALKTDLESRVPKQQVPQADGGSVSVTGKGVAECFSKLDAFVLPQQRDFKDQPNGEQVQQ